MDFRAFLGTLLVSALTLGGQNLSAQSSLTEPASADAASQPTTSLAGLEHARFGLATSDPLPLRISSATGLLQDDDGKSHWLTGAIIGFVAGAAITALVVHSGGSNSLCNRSANQDALSSTECVALIGVGGVAGAGVGAFIGGRIR